MKYTGASIHCPKHGLQKSNPNTPHAVACIKCFPRKTVIKECAMCNKEFETPKHSAHLRKFCSKKCHMKYVHDKGFRKAGDN